MDYCPGHSGYSEDIHGNCKFCGKPRRTPAPSSSPLGEVNPFELGRLLAKKREQERRNKIPQYSDCPRGHKHALFYNTVNDSFTCSECKYALLAGTEEYKAVFLKIVDTEQPFKREPSPQKTDKHDLFANVIWPDDSSKPIEEQAE